MAPAGQRDEARDRVAQVFTRVEDVLYLGLSVLLVASAFGLLVTTGIDFVRSVAEAALGDRVVDLLDRILLVLMIVEILYTVQVSFREHVLSPEPFLVVGLIAAIRRILVLTAEFSDLAEAGPQAFRAAMLELALLTAMVVALVLALGLLRRWRVSAIAEKG
ncbi:MAG TPA: phosphate-starvation-inducible PsiE family protein [Candidatus Tectomicrobia bacterium]|nr:phosphate-starvation-inducible PsiE family protein [Candidatus Tectomicrobia bacterium]